MSEEKTTRKFGPLAVSYLPEWADAQVHDLGDDYLPAEGNPEAERARACLCELCNALMVAATRTAGSYDGVSGGPLVRQRASALMYEAATVRWGAWSSWRRGAAVNEWVERYYALTEAFARVRPGWATTIHKSQGSTYDEVFLVESEVVRKASRDHSFRNMLLYVGYSRARKGLYLS